MDMPSGISCPFSTIRRLWTTAARKKIAAPLTPRAVIIPTPIPLSTSRFSFNGVAVGAPLAAEGAAVGDSSSFSKIFCLLVGLKDEVEGEPTGVAVGT